MMVQLGRSYKRRSSSSHHLLIEFHGNVDLGHALRGNQFAFGRDSVVGHGQCKIDYNIEARLSHRSEIFRLRHAARGQPIIYA